MFIGGTEIDRVESNVSAISSAGAGFLCIIYKSFKCYCVNHTFKKHSGIKTRIGASLLTLLSQLLIAAVALIKNMLKKKVGRLPRLLTTGKSGETQFAIFRFIARHTKSLWLMKEK